MTVNGKRWNVKAMRRKDACNLRLLLEGAQKDKDMSSPSYEILGLEMKSTTNYYERP